MKGKWLRLITMVIIFVYFIGFININGYAFDIIDLNGNKITLEDFADVKNHWAIQYIYKGKYYDLIQGIRDNKTQLYYFKPDSYITRRDFAVILNRIAKYKVPNINFFIDLENNQYYTNSILALNARGIIFGYNNRVRPHDNLTREEAITMLARMFKVDGFKYSSIELPFKDKLKISNWALDYIKWAYKKGYIQGDNKGNFNPKSNITRAETITILVRIFKAYFNQAFRYSGSVDGDAIVAESGAILDRYKLNGDLYLFSDQLTINNSNISGNIIVLTDPSSQVILNLSNSVVSDIYCNDSNLVLTLNDNSKLNSIVLNNSTVDLSTNSLQVSVPNKIIMKGFSQLKIDGSGFLINNGITMIVDRDTLFNAIAEYRGYTFSNMPQLVYEILTNDLRNNVFISKLRLVGSTFYDISEVGVLISYSSTVPTLSKYDDKVIIDSSLLSNGNIIQSYKLGTLTKDFAQYRLYFKGSKGEVRYFDSVVLVKRDIRDLKFTLVEKSPITDSQGKQIGVNKTFELLVIGKNIPQINSVLLLCSPFGVVTSQFLSSVVSNNTNNTVNNTVYGTTYSTQSIYIQPDITTIQMTKIKEVNENGLVKISYQGTYSYYDSPGKLKCNYFGYRVVFEGSLGYHEEFPSYVEGQNVDISDIVQTVNTGDTRFESGWLIISNNSFDNVKGIVQEVGVRIGIASISTYTDLKESLVKRYIDCKSYDYRFDSIDNKFSAGIKMDALDGNVIFYKAYVKTTTGVLYGPTKVIVYPDTFIDGGLRDYIIQGGICYVRINTIVYNPINDNSMIMYVSDITNNKSFDEYVQKKLKDIGAIYDNGILTIPLKGLQKGCVYKIRLYVYSNTKGFEYEYVVYINN